MNTDTLPVLTDSIFQTIFEKSPGSLLVKADLPLFTIVAASDDYLQITSSTRSCVTGKGFFEVFPDEGQADNQDGARRVFTRVAQTGEKVVVPVYRYDVRNDTTGAYETRFWSCCNTAIFDSNGSVAYILNTVVDITGEVNAKEDAIENENKLRLAAEAAALGTWELSIANQSFTCSARLAEIFGHGPDEPVTLAQVRSQVHAEDLQNVVIKAFHESLVTGKYLYEVRIYWADGSLHWIKIQGMVMTNEKGVPVSLLGTIMDITESKSDEIRKNDFIAMASHELKTPLTSLKAYVQLLAKRISASDDSFVHTALSKANLQINRMTDLIHGFLDLSKLEPGKLKLKLQEFELNRLIGETVADTLALSSHRQIIFEPGEQVAVIADRQKIAQVISNFLSNAIKYSDKEGKITVACQKLGGQVRVAVTDEGIGIKPKDQEKLFQRFYRVESEKMKNISGFGIGLYLANEIIQMHNGTIGIKSKEHEGSTFFFTLPLPTA